MLFSVSGLLEDGVNTGRAFVRRAVSARSGLGEQLGHPTYRSGNATCLSLFAISIASSACSLAMPTINWASMTQEYAMTGHGSAIASQRSVEIVVKMIEAAANSADSANQSAHTLEHLAEELCGSVARFRI
jgi:hypothetical protein